MQDKYIRDPETGALLSTDHSGLRAYKLQKKKSKQITEMSDDINSLKNELSEIKSLLKTIIHR